MEPYWDLIKQIVRESDIVLEILDSRLIDISRNKEIERIIKEKNRPKIIVLNKADLVSRKELEISVEKLKKELIGERGEVVYVSMKQKRTIKNLIVKIRQVFSKYGKREDYNESNPIIKKPYREAKSDIVIGVVGYPNVGKSSIINALAFKKKAKVSSKAGTTHGIHWISANNEIKLIDTPGVIPLEYIDESNLGLIAARNPEKLKDPDVTAGKIIELFIKNKKINNIEYIYNVRLEEKENPYTMIDEIARKKGCLKKGGMPDSVRMSIKIVHDWQEGRLKL